MRSTVLIIGVTGQTGAYLARSLLSNGHSVVGTSRGVDENNLFRLEQLGVAQEIEVDTLDPTNWPAVCDALERRTPQAVFFLGGQSSVGDSFNAPIETFKSISLSVQNLLEAIRLSHSHCVFVNSASSEMFGSQPGIVLNEGSPMRPVSPYGVAKLASYWATRQYREAFQLKAFNAILSNHESILRGDQFVTQKIVKQLRQIADGARDSLSLGNLDVERDWLWAGDVAEALRCLLSVEVASDFVIGSGQSHSLKDLVAASANSLGLDENIQIRVDSANERPLDIPSVRLDPALFIRTTNWTPTISFDEMAEKLVLGRL